VCSKKINQKSDHYSFEMSAIDKDIVSDQLTFSINFDYFSSFSIVEYGIMDNVDNFFLYKKVASEENQ
jgi:hypothetical protein